MKEEKNNKGFLVFAWIVVVVLIFQSGLLVFSFVEIRGLTNDLSIYRDNLVKANNSLNKKIDVNSIELQSKINELSKSLMDTQTSLIKEVSNIKAQTSSDFSGIIENSIMAVVSIRTDVSQGTGFIISRDGYVVTNAHVLSEARYAEAITSDKEVKRMSLIGYNLTLDTALLKIDGNYDYLELDDSDDVRVGEKVIAIGNPLGLSFSVSEGIVSAVHRTGSNDLDAYIQTDASLNPGNSGGPLINTHGKVIGINNFKAQAENIGFALESDYIKESINRISLENLNRTILN